MRGHEKYSKLLAIAVGELIKIAELIPVSKIYRSMDGQHLKYLEGVYARTNVTRRRNSYTERKL